MPPTRDTMGIRGVERDVFDSFSCGALESEPGCGNDAFIQLTRFAFDHSQPVPDAFGSNQRIQCSRCQKQYTFRDGRWVQHNILIKPPREPKRPVVRKVRR